LHVFPYSERPGTAAPRLGRPVHPQAAADRSAELREVARQKGEMHIARRHGQPADLVVTGRIRGAYQGLTEDYLEVSLNTDSPLEARIDAVLQYEAGKLRAVFDA